MTITIKFRDSDARAVHGYLKHRYQSRASLEKLAKIAIRDIVAQQAGSELAEMKMLRNAEETADFETAIAAAMAYDEVALREHGEFARLNFPAAIRREGEGQ